VDRSDSCKPNYVNRGIIKGRGSLIRLRVRGDLLHHNCTLFGNQGGHDLTENIGKCSKGATSNVESTKICKNNSIREDLLLVSLGGSDLLNDLLISDLNGARVEDLRVVLGDAADETLLLELAESAAGEGTVDPELLNHLRNGDDATLRDVLEKGIVVGGREEDGVVELSVADTAGTRSHGSNTWSDREDGRAKGQ
jgi:hypothetical protein